MAAAPKFAHLHVHSHYSMLDGACRVPELVSRAKELGMDALALTDHGVMHGAVEFYAACKDAGVKPLVGVEAYMAPGDRRERSTPGGNAGEAAYHLLLIAQNLTGYRNLLKLSKVSFTEGFYYKPRIDKATLKELSEGLICTSSCLGGEVASAFMKSNMAAAKSAAETYLEIFGPDRFFIEVQKHIPEQDAVNPELAALAKRLGVGLVGTNDVHFLKKEDHGAHDCLCCISTGRLVSDEKRLIYPKELYLKSPAEMAEALKEWPEAVENTTRIAGMVDLELDFSKRYAPVYKVEPEKLTAPATPEMKDDERYLRQLCDEGLEWRYGTRAVPQDVRDRLDYELKVIASKGFCSYFLIVWDFCNHARADNVPVGARGSGVGTMVGYLLGLCNVDPLKYGLLFERFMDPSRSEMPDIDIDICQDGRAGVIDYVRHKYGHVAQIVTFGTLAAKAACKDVGRVLNVPLADINKLTGYIPAIPGMTIDRAIGQVPDLRKMIDGSTQLQQVITIAKRLEGLCRNAGVHAAGVIIADQPLDDLIPLCKDKEGNLLAQFEGPIAEKCGLLKMDFLGLRTLSVLQRSIELAKAAGRLPRDFDIEKVDLADQTVLKLFCRGETKGVFQFESGGMQDLLIKMQPDRVEDLIAANALYRPGPMELIPTYCNRKHGREPVPSVHPIMDAILAETYGIMVYQEQVMQIFNQLGGIELSNAYKLIKAISKKTAAVIEKFKPDFLKGAKAKGVGEKQAKEIFDLILKFGGYGFNKSHSTRYAIVAFQTAYMKVYHPVDYMAALLTYEMGNSEKTVDYISECQRMRIDLLPPDVNESGKDFTPVFKKKGKQGSIRFGLCAVRGVGEKAVEHIVEKRANGNYGDLFDFCDRIDTRAVQRNTAEALVRCGAFSSLHKERAPVLAALDGAFEGAVRKQEDERNGQFAMFGGQAATVVATSAALPKIGEFQPSELLQMEKELLGFYVTSHPLRDCNDLVDRFTTHTTRDALSLGEGGEVLMPALIGAVRTRVAKQGKNAGQRWAIVELEDLEGKIEGIVFSDQYAEILQRDANLLKADRVVVVKGKIDRKRETPCLVLSEVFGIEDCSKRLTSSLILDLSVERHRPEHVEQVKPLLAAEPGNIEVVVRLPDVGGHKAMVKLGRKYGVRPTPDLVMKLRATLGDDSVELLGPGVIKRRRQEQQRMFAQVAEAETGAVAAVAPVGAFAGMGIEDTFELDDD